MDMRFPGMLRAVLPAALFAAVAVSAGCSESNAASGRNSRLLGFSSASRQTGSLAVVAGQPSGQGYRDGSRDAARFSYPGGMRFDAAGAMYVADSRNSVIRRIDRSGSVTTVAGTVDLPGSADGRGAAARFNSPSDIAIDAAGVIYIADSANNTIRKVLPDGSVTTLAGAAGQPGSADGSGAAARFNGPNGLALDRDGNLYVVDSWNCTIRKITPAGQVSTVAGTAGAWGYADGNGAAAQFNGPTAIAIDAAGMLYVTDGSNTIRKITPAGDVMTLAGAAWQGGEADGAGSSARFNGPSGVAIDAAGNVFVADAYGNTVRKVTPAGEVTTIAGSGNVGSQDGTGVMASFKGPNRLAFDSSGNLYVTDSNSAIRRIDAGNIVTTWAGATGQAGSLNGPALAARFSFPNGLAVDPSGNIYLADQDNATIRKLGVDGNVTTIAGSAGVWGSADGTAAAAQFGGPGGVAVAPDGSLYVSEFSNNTIRKITQDGKVTTLAGTAGQSGNADGAGADARFSAPNCVAVDRQGNLYVADYNNNTIRKISPAGVVTTIAGNGQPGAADGIGAAARFNGPNSIAIDDGGNLFVTDSVNNTIRKITPGGVVSTVAGLAGAAGSADGMGRNARFSYPWEIAVDRKGNLYVADSGNNALRLVTPAGVVSTLAGVAGAPYANVPGTLPAGLAFPIGVALDDSRHRILVTVPDAVLSVPVQ
ncbi:MAG: NHL repeat-containing protein [Telluria sp.]